jgi:hypothetical protein
MAHEYIPRVFRLESRLELLLTEDDSKVELSTGRACSGRRKVQNWSSTTCHSAAQLVLKSQCGINMGSAFVHGKELKSHNRRVYSHPARFEPGAAVVILVNADSPYRVALAATQDGACTESADKNFERCISRNARSSSAGLIVLQSAL